MPRHSGGRAAPADRDLVFRAVADPIRRAILDRLRAGPRPVHQIAGAFRISRPAISRHLRILRSARLLSEQRQGRERLYRYEPAPLRALDLWLERHRPGLCSALRRLERDVETDPFSQEASHGRADRADPR